MYYLSSFTGFLIRKYPRPTGSVRLADRAVFLAFALTIILHMVFPVASQTAYTSSGTMDQSIQELEDYIDRLDVDFGLIQGVASPAAEKLEDAFDGEK